MEVNRPGQREIDRWEAFVTQTDWTGPVVQESWYGHHHPGRRLGIFIHLSAVLGTLVLSWHGFSHWPILRPYMDANALVSLKDAHSGCLEAICYVLEPVEFSCEMLPDGRVVVDPVPVARIPLPEECHEAIALTFGDKFEREILQRAHGAMGGHTDESPREIDLIHFEDTPTITEGIPLFRILPDLCLAQETLMHDLFHGDAMWGPANAVLAVDLVGSIFMEPGDRERVELRSLACPRFMNREIQDVFLPAAKRFYDFLITWRRSAGVGLIYWLHVAYYSATCASRVFQVFLPSLILWLLMPTFQNRGNRITLIRTISVLVLITTIVSEGSGGLDEVLRTGILVVHALTYKNERAAIEWLFIFCLSFLGLNQIASDVLNSFFPEPSPVIDQTFKFDGLALLDLFLTFLLPGDGLWKLVVLYVLYLAFPRKPKQD